MNRITRHALAIAFAMSLGAPVLAHHSASMFDDAKVVEKKGTVKELQWTNPHVWLQVVIDENGKKTEWSLEGGSPNTLSRRGLTRQSLGYGTELIVDGYQTKDHSLKRANGRDVTFTDSRKACLASSGTGAPRDGRDPTEPPKKPPVR